MKSEGPQVVARAAALLRAVGDCEPDGASTTILAGIAGIPRPTAHRLLSSLAEEGLVDRAGTTARWHVGPELYLLGTAAGRRYDVSEAAREVVRTLAAKTGESAFFSARRGDQAVCLVREDGSFPLRSHVLHEGLRLPMGVASAGMVLLAHLTDRDIDNYLGRVDLVPEWGAQHSTTKVRERIDQTRLDGYAINPGLLVEGSWGLGAVVFDRLDAPSWALSLTGVESRFRADRVPELGMLLIEQAHALTRALRPVP